MTVAKSNDLRETRDRNAVLGQIERAIAEARATSRENDLLGAISLGARALSRSAGVKNMIVIDSGLQTTGAIRFQDRGGAVLAADPRAVADKLRADGRLPKLTGVHLTFVGLGDVTAPQPQLNETARHNLLQIWSQIVAAAGGTSTIDEFPSRPAAPLKGLPPVSIVPVQRGSIDLSRPVELLDSVTGFVPDTAQFQDQRRTMRTLRPYAEEIARRNKRVLLTGTTTDAGGPTGRLKLSVQRANAVRAILVELGVREDLLRTRGVGSNFPGFRPDRDSDGRLDPVLAALNRKVVISLDEP